MKGIFICRGESTCVASRTTVVLQPQRRAALLRIHLWLPRILCAPSQATLQFAAVPPRLDPAHPRICSRAHVQRGRTVLSHFQAAAIVAVHLARASCRQASRYAPAPRVICPMGVSPSHVHVGIRTAMRVLLPLANSARVMPASALLSRDAPGSGALLM